MEKDVSTEQRSEQRQKSNRRLAEFLRHPGYEVIPLAGVEESVVEHVPRDISLTVTASPGKGMPATVDLAERLAAHGFRVAPHLSARLIRDRSELAEILQRLREAGIRDAFVVAGDVSEPAGEFEGAAACSGRWPRSGTSSGRSASQGIPRAIRSSATRPRSRRCTTRPRTPTTSSARSASTRRPSEWARWVKLRGVDSRYGSECRAYVNRQKLMRISAAIGLGESARSS